MQDLILAKMPSNSCFIQQFQGTQDDRHTSTTEFQVMTIRKWNGLRRLCVTQRTHMIRGTCIDFYERVVFLWHHFLATTNSL